MSTPAPRTIAEYLEQLRAALHDADPALIQDALYDAEEHLRSEMHENRGKSETEVLAELRALASKNKVARSFIGAGYHDCITPPEVSPQPPRR